jgi:hypothetical protein
MRAREMKQLLALLDTVTTAQRRELLQRLQGAPQHEQVLGDT